MIITVNVNGETFDVNVGEGKQTFKWLASVVATRAKTFKVLREDFEDDGFIVTGLRNGDGDLVNPIDTIAEHCSSGADKFSVFADITTTFDSDEWGNPIRGEWMTAAYVRSSSSKIWSDEMTAWRERFGKSGSRNQTIATETDAPPLSPRLRSSLIQIGDQFSPEDIETAFKLDFKQMTWAWLEAVPTTSLTLLSDVVQSQYGLLCNIFLHYCGVGKGNCKEL